MSKAVWQGKFLEAHVAPWGDSGQWEFVKRTRGIQAAVIVAPVPAETKFCTVSPAIWLKVETVVSAL